MSVAQRGSEEVGDSGTGRPEGVDLIRRLVSAQRRLLKERAGETLISHIQSLSGLEGFLKSPSFDDLNSAAAYGPVIIINQSRFRSYVIILFKDSNPSIIIFTPSDIHDRADHFKDELLRARKENSLDSEDYDLALTYVPAVLYELIGKPVVERLRQSRVPKKCRVWCSLRIPQTWLTNQST